MFKIERDSKGRALAYAWPGGYPLYYVCDDGGELCPTCCDTEREAIDSSGGKDGWNVVGVGVHYEGEPIVCDHCGRQIESAYGVPSEGD